MIEISNTPVVRVFTSGHDLIEGNAMAQLKKTARQPGIRVAAGLPDLHQGKGGPVGAAFLSSTYFYPHLIGNDIGCGMGFWKTSIKKQKIKLDKWVKKLAGMEPGLKEMAQHARDDRPLGSIGGGNHFAELMLPERIVDDQAFHSLGLDKKHLCILVHSGSRGIGNAVLRRHVDRYKSSGLSMDSADGKEYLRSHDLALEWARENRAAIAENFAGKLGTACTSILDLCHNSITPWQIREEQFWLHRKGAAPSDSGMVIIPGSRGSLTYLVRPVGDQAANLWSLPHGAGRKWNRKSCKDRLKDKFTRSSLSQTSLGSRVICGSSETLFEEAPQVFKNIERIMDDLVRQGLIDLVATFRPLITYKPGRQS
ncbi:MAG: RNA ligase RtcB family protein [Desulfobacterales bacterium]|nr:RNA ligase RtcB family protein [Desulfobacterales bacterium]